MMRKVRVRTWVILAAVAFVLVVILQNDDPIRLQILFWKADASQLLVLPAMLLVGFAFGFATAAWFFRRRRPFP